MGQARLASRLRASLPSNRTNGSKDLQNDPKQQLNSITQKSTQQSLYKMYKST